VILTAASRIARSGRRRLGLRGGLRSGVASLAATYVERHGLATLTVGVVVTAASSILELLNPGNTWLLFEDVSSAVAPTTAALAVAIAASRGSPEFRPFRRALAFSVGLTAVGQLVADIPDVTHKTFAPLAAISDVCYVVGAALGIATLTLTLYRQLPRDARRTVVLDALVILFAGMTFVFANWLHQSFMPGNQVATLFADPTSNLVVPLVSTIFFASAGAVVVGAFSLKLEPAPRGVWAVTLGMALLALAWQGWIGRFLAGGADTIEPMDFVFPAGALVTAYGGITWTLARGGGLLYERIARTTSDWLPVVAIVGCAILDVMPRTRPLQVDPIAVGTAAVVLLAVIRQWIFQSRERATSARLTTEISERAATTVSLARLDAAPTIEATADRICSEALRIDGIDTVVLFAFSPIGVVPIARSGEHCRPLVVGQPIPDDYGGELMEHAAFGLWLESWTSRTPHDDFDRSAIAAGLRAEALAPLIWNDEPIGLLSVGATSAAHERRLADRLATLTEFSVMSAAVLGPMLSERWQRDRTRADIQGVIAAHAFTPVFQPIVDLATREFVGYEALTRFNDGTRPDLRFLEADKVDMMVQLEMATLNAQVEQAKQLPEGAFLSLNVSPTLATCLTPLLDVMAAADRALVLEVTEHVEIDDYPRLMAALNQVRPHAMLAVDDAGAGYAGLRHILELRPEFVKLDISLVRNIDSDPARQAMVSGMARFAESVGCALIAEGIETENELTAVRLLKVGFGQGYFLSRPATIGAIVESQRSAAPVLQTAKRGRRRRAA
jgi:EAL domain-containing protein (putative c-di-GMP-specific phosphodiesterase class I)